MIRLAFLLPLILCLAWAYYLKRNGWSLGEGKKGFMYIIGLSAIIAAFYSLMYVLNHHFD